MELAQANKIILTMKPLIIALIYTAYVFLSNRHTVVISVALTLAYISFKIESICAFCFAALAQIPSQTIEIIESGKSTIEIIVYVATTLATLYGIFRGWGWFVSRREKRKTIYEDNAELLVHVNEMKEAVLAGSKEILQLTVSHHKQILEVTKQSQSKDVIIEEQKAKIDSAKLKCNNQCHD